MTDFYKFWDNYCLFTTLYPETTKWIPTQTSKKQNFFNFCANELARSKNWKNFVFWIFGDGIRKGHRSRLFQGFGAYIVWFWHFKTNFKFFGYFIHLALFSNFSKILEDFWQILEDFLHFWYFFFHYFDRLLHKLMF